MGRVRPPFRYGFQKQFDSRGAKGLDELFLWGVDGLDGQKDQGDARGCVIIEKHGLSVTRRNNPN
jgi:hypothetical protein